VTGYTFTAIIEPDEYSWHAYCPALVDRGGATWGETREQARAKSGRGRQDDHCQPGRAWRADRAELSGDDAMKFTRISVDPKQIGGVPCIRGLRIPVATVVAMFADGMLETEILAAYPDLERDDIFEALQYAAEAVCERELPLVAP